MKALMSRHAGESKTRAVEAAIEEHLRHGALERLLALQGKLDIEDVSAQMRALDRKI